MTEIHSLMHSIFLNYLSVACLKSPHTPLTIMTYDNLKKYSTVVWKKKAIVFHKYMYTGMYILHLYLFVAF